MLRWYDQNFEATSVSRLKPADIYRLSSEKTWEQGSERGTEGGRLWRSQCRYPARCLVPHQLPRKRHSFFPVICATSFLPLPRYLLLFHSTSEKMGDVRGDGGIFFFFFFPVCLTSLLFPLASSCCKVPDTDEEREIDSEPWGKVRRWGTQGESMRKERAKTTRRWSMRDGDLSGKELSSNQPGVCPTGGCAHSGKKKKKGINISRKMTHLEKKVGG